MKHSLIRIGVFVGVILVSSPAYTHDAEDCRLLVDKATQVHKEMRKTYSAYQKLRVTTDAEHHSSKVLQAAEHTLELVTETLNKWVEVLVCSEVLEYDGGKEIEH